MYILTFIISLLFIALLLFYVFPLKIFFTFNSELQPDYNIMMTWLNPLFKGTITNGNGGMLLTVYIFNKKAFTKKLKGNKGSSSTLSDKIDKIKALKPEHFNIYAAYGFEDPSITGMICGALDLISQQEYLNTLDNKPDFSTDETYFSISAEAEINALLALMSLFRIRSSNLNMQPLRGGR